MFDYNGAAIATVLSEMLITVLTLYYLFKTDFKPDLSLLKTVIKIIFVGIVLAIALYFINVSMWLAIPIGIIIYIVLLVITRLIDYNDKYIINEILK